MRKGSISLHDPVTASVCETLFSFHMMKMMHNDSRFKNTFLWGHAYNYEIMTPLLVTWVRTISYNMKNNRIVQGMLVYPIFSTIYFL